jgi:sigma-B regulation protein RsbU (phosphoserine phosphatase)
MAETDKAQRILIVDDDPRNVKIVKLILLEKDYDLATAAGGVEALEKARDFDPDLVLLDVMMPGMSGVAVAGELKSNEATRHIPVIMLTARADMETLEEAFGNGAMDYIRKPFSDRELMLRVENALALKRASDENRRWRKQMTRDLNLAGSLQTSILSTQPSYTRHFDAYMAFQPSIEVGGDVFDVLDLPDGRSCVYVGDVAGHGVGPAMASCLVKAMLSELLRTSSLVTPVTICQELEIRFRKYLPDPSMYMTLFLMILDEPNACWNCLSCGHPPPLIYCGGTRLIDEVMESTGGLPIGFNTQLGMAYSDEDEFQIPIEPGMKIVLYTDGLLEATHRSTGEMCEPAGVARGYEQLCKDGATDDMAQRLIRAIDDAGYSTEADDCSAITLDFIPNNGYACYSISPSTDAVRLSGRRVCEALLDVDWPEETAHAIELLVVEYVNNVIDHSHLATDESIDLVVRQYSDELCMIFSDYGPPWDIENHRAKSQHTETLAMRGRGLSIIEEVARTLQFFRTNSQNYCILNVKRDWKPAEEAPAAT